MQRNRIYLYSPVVDVSLFYLNMTENSSYNSLEESKGTKTQNIADEQELQRFSGERSVSRGFELTFNPSLSVYIVKPPPKFHLKFFKNSALANSIAVEKFEKICYNKT